MTELLKRRLGRTDFQVTALGYGTMELRGAPSGPDLTDEAAEKVLNAVLDAGINFIDHLNRLRTQRGIDRALHRASPRRVLPRLQMRLRSGCRYGC